MGTGRLGQRTDIRGLTTRWLAGHDFAAALLLTCGLARTTVIVWHPSGSVVAPGTPLRTRGRGSGKPMPAAGETAHVRRLIVD